MKVSDLIEKLGARRDEYLDAGKIKNAVAIHEIVVDLEDHLLITGNHELGPDWKLDA